MAAIKDKKVFLKCDCCGLILATADYVQFQYRNKTNDLETQTIPFQRALAKRHGWVKGMDRLDYCRRCVTECSCLSNFRDRSHVDEAMRKYHKKRGR